MTSSLESAQRNVRAAVIEASSARFQGDLLLAWDGLGRVVGVSLGTGNAISEWRIS